MQLFFSQRPKRKSYLVLDIGTETIKVLVLEKLGEKIILSAALSEYFDSYGLANGQNSEGEIAERIINSCLQVVKKEIKKQPENVLFALPANLFRAKIIFQSFRRKSVKEPIGKKEADSIRKEILLASQKKISDLVAEGIGILAQDIHFVSVEIIEIKIDGYQVPNLQGYSGEDLVFRILITFLPKDNFKNIENLARTHRFKKITLLHAGQSLTKLHLPGIENSIFLDIGGEETQIFLMKDGKLEKADKFDVGAKEFSKSLSRSLGIRNIEGRELKERYSKKLLSIEVKNRIREIFAQPQREWYENLKSKIKEINPAGLLPSNLFLAGGGSLLPEIQEILEEGEWQGLHLMYRPKVKIVYPKDCYPAIQPKEEGVLGPILNNPQYTPSLLIFYAGKIF